MPAMIERDLCHYCRERFNEDRRRTWDHVIPKCLGGPTSWWNLVPACFACNQAKASLLVACPCSKCVEALDRFCATASDKVLRRLSGWPTAGVDRLIAASRAAASAKADPLPLPPMTPGQSAAAAW